MQAVPESKSGYSFVYFLINDDDIVYIGQSKNLEDRISQHGNSKEFDRFTYFEVSDCIVDIVESCYIHKIRPALNGNLNNSGNGSDPEKHTPVSISRMCEILCDLAEKEQKLQDAE